MGKIPPQAKKVFNGVIFDVYQWDQEMFDGSRETFEMVKRADTVDVIAITPEKNFLITRQSQPGKENFYSLLGGRVEPDEKPVDAAKRELLEESGYVSGDWELFATEDPYSKMEWTIYYYIARDVKKIQEQTLDPGEKIEVLEKNFLDFVTLVDQPEFRGGKFADMLLRAQREGNLHIIKRKLLGE